MDVTNRSGIAFGLKQPKTNLYIRPLYNPLGYINYKKSSLFLIVLTIYLRHEYI